MLALGLAVSLTATGCQATGDGSGTAQGTKLKFQLNSPVGGYNSGFFLAKELGYYADAGLDVTIEEGNGSINTSKLVASGDAVIAFSDPIPTMGLIQQGAPILVAATVFQTSPNGVVALEKSGIKQISDLNGKSVAVPNGLMQEQVWPLLIKANNLDAKSINVVKMAANGMVPQLISGKVDAILGSADNYAIQVEQQGEKAVTLPFSDNGIATIAHSIIVNTDYAKKNPEVVRKFIGASMRGWAAAATDHDAAVDAVAKSFPANAKRDRNLLELAADLPLLCANGAKSAGKAEPHAWEATWRILVDIEALPSSSKPESFYTYDYLPTDLKAC